MRKMETAPMPPAKLHSALDPLHGKRAAVLAFAFYPSDTRIRRSAEAMASAGMVVDLLCLQQMPDEPRREVINGVRVFRSSLKKRRSGRLAYLYQYLVFLCLAFAWLARRGFPWRHDVVHVHNMPDFLVFSTALAKVLGSRVILDLHDPTPEVFITIYGLSPGHWLVSALQRVERWSVRFADLVLTPNLAFQSLFVARGCPTEKIGIVMNTPSERWFPLTEPVVRAGGVERPFTLMYHGTLVERHGLHDAVRALAPLRDQIPNLRFHIYGEPTEYLRQVVLPLVEQLGVSDLVKTFGEQPQEVIARAVAGCDLGLVPNLRTIFTEINLPTRIFEYLALGKPVITPRTRGVADYFGPEDLFHFEAGDAQSLAARIAWVAGHPVETDAVVRRGQAIYRRHLWRDEEHRFLEGIRGLVSRPPRTRPSLPTLERAS